MGCTNPHLYSPMCSPSMNAEEMNALKDEIKEVEERNAFMLELKRQQDEVFLNEFKERAAKIAQNYDNNVYPSKKIEEILRASPFVILGKRKQDQPEKNIILTTKTKHMDIEKLKKGNQLDTDIKEVRRQIERLKDSNYWEFHPGCGSHPTEDTTKKLFEISTAAQKLVLKRLKTLLASLEAEFKKL